MDAKSDLSNFVGSELMGLATEKRYHVHPFPTVDALIEAWENMGFGVSLDDREGKAEFYIKNPNNSITYGYDYLSCERNLDFPGVDFNALCGLMSLTYGNISSKEKSHGNSSPLKTSLDFCNRFKNNLQTYFVQYKDNLIVSSEGNLSELEESTLFDYVYENHFLSEIYKEVVSNESFGIFPSKIPSPEELDDPQFERDLDPYEFFPTRKEVFSNFFGKYLNSMAFQKGFNTNCSSYEGVSRLMHEGIYGIE